MQFVVLAPSTIVTVPVDTAFTTLPDTVAMPGVSLDQITFWFVALAGETVATKVSLPIARRDVADLFRPTPLTATVTVQFAVKPPSTVVTVIVAVPADTAFITPPDAVATPGVSLDQITF
jgi:hypothetical protein